MKPRIPLSLAQGVREAMLGLQRFVDQSSIEHSLLLLVDLRASQINGCAYCIDMHSKEARASGETEQRLYALDAWRDTPFYTPRERAALAWTEAVTLVADDRVPDAVFEEAHAAFDEKELVELTLAIVAINGWNRLNVAFRNVPGDYRVGQFKRGASA
ncbi:MAG TPA: carboxymuconolactone decarboxylase family protein [Casimicrobiaceae bacterium]